MKDDQKISTFSYLLMASDAVILVSFEPQGVYNSRVKTSHQRRANNKEDKPR